MSKEFTPCYELNTAQTVCNKIWLLLPLLLFWWVKSLLAVFSLFVLCSVFMYHTWSGLRLY